MLKKTLITLLAALAMGTFQTQVASADVVVVDHGNQPDTNEWDAIIVGIMAGGFGATTATFATLATSEQKEDKAELIHVASNDSIELLAQGDSNAKAEGFLANLFAAYRTQYPSEAKANDIGLARSFLLNQVK